MPTWSLASTDSFYRHTLLDSLTKNPQEDEPGRAKDLFLRYLLESDPLGVCVTHAAPGTAKNELENTENGESNHDPDLADLVSILHVGNSWLNLRIAAFYGSTGVCNGGIYSMPYESTLYLNSIYGSLNRRGIPKTHLYDLLQGEIVNGMACMHPLGGRHAMLFKPTGTANGAIEAISAVVNGTTDCIEVESEVCFKLYPSCLFFKDPYETTTTTATTHNPYHNEDPYNPRRYVNVRDLDSPDEYTGASDPQYVPDEEIGVDDDPYDSPGGWWRRRQQQHMDEEIYNSTSSQYFEPFRNTPQQGEVTYRKYYKYRYFTSSDSNILEIRTGGSAFYARSANGIYVGRYTIDNDEWQLQTLNNQHYGERQKVYYMQPNPFIPAECAMLTNNTLMLYDATQEKERQCVSLNRGPKPSEFGYDIMQSLAFSVNMDTLILGGNRLYTLDLRTNKMENLLTKSKSFNVTAAIWTERLSKTLSSDKTNLAGASCAFSTYWKPSSPSFWGAFTAITTHPVYRYIMACAYGTSNCIYIWDLRLPLKPILEIPLPSMEYLGARFRDLTWSLSGLKDGDSTLVAFCWRQRFPIACKFRINRTITRFTMDQTVDTERKLWNNWTKDSAPSWERHKYIPRRKRVQEDEQFTEQSLHGEALDVEDATTTDPDEQIAGSQTQKRPKLFNDFLSGKVFEDDIELTMMNTKSLQIMRVPPEETAAKLQSVGPLIESQDDYAKMPFKVTQKEAVFNIFHGYAGVCVLEKGKERVLCACTMSGSIFAMDLDLKRRVRCAFAEPSTDQMSVEKHANALFRYIKETSGPITLPPGFITDGIKNIRVKLNTPPPKPPQPIVTVCLTKEFAGHQEEPQLPLTSSGGDFDSKALLKWLLKQSNDGDASTEKRDIMSLKEFEERIGPRVHLEELATNVWDCNNIKIDFEYDSTNVNNRFLDPTPSCHCFTRQRPDHQRRVLLSYLKALKVQKEGTITMDPLDDFEELMESALQKDGTMEEYLRCAVKEGLEEELPSNVDAKGMVHEKEIVNRILFHSPILPRIKGDETRDQHPTQNQEEGVHKHYCGVGNLIAIKLRDHEATQRSERIQKLLDTWKTSGDTTEGDVGQGITRFHKPSDQIEATRQTQTERDHLVKQLLSRTEN